MITVPFLLYVYPWMPFPRRVVIYLRERGISSSLVTVVRVSDPQDGNAVAKGFPPRPVGSLPILAIPSGDEQYIYVRQSLAIMNYLDELCESGSEGFPRAKYSMRGTDTLSRARVTELLALADELTTAWNPVRTFGTEAGTLRIPEASQEMMRWVRRVLLTIESWFEDSDCSSLRDKGTRGPNMAEIVLYQFLEFTNDCYGKDMTAGSGDTLVDVYKREVVDQFPKLAEFYKAFKTRPSAIRNEADGEVPSSQVLKAMQTWNW
jgi:glutathione S-transferase